MDFLDQGGLQNIPLDRGHTFPTVLSYTSSKASLSYSIRTFDPKKYKRACVCVCVAGGGGSDPCVGMRCGMWLKR